MSRDVTQAVKDDLDARTARGVSKYGVSLTDAHLADPALIRHAYEEALDLAQYLKTLLLAHEGSGTIVQIDKAPIPPGFKFVDFVELSDGAWATVIAPMTPEEIAARKALGNP